QQSGKRGIVLDEQNTHDRCRLERLQPKQTPDCGRHMGCAMQPRPVAAHDLRPRQAGQDFVSAEGHAAHATDCGTATGGDRQGPRVMIFKPLLAAVATLIEDFPAVRAVARPRVATASARDPWPVAAARLELSNAAIRAELAALCAARNKCDGA